MNTEQRTFLLVGLITAQMLAVMPARAQFTNASQCLSETFSTKGAGLSLARQKWAALVHARKGDLWSDIDIAADYRKRCGKNKANKTQCTVEARPCRPDDTLRIQTIMPIIQ